MTCMLLKIDNTYTYIGDCSCNISTATICVNIEMIYETLATITIVIFQFLLDAEATCDICTVGVVVEVEAFFLMFSCHLYHCYSHVASDTKGNEEPKASK